ncbi:MAG: trypsin-like peptidase domain-containing protein [Planctomycetaceae bacterium]|nr:trypsin-like peptidase domain-containing protein [Planctomycetaceae bacterium]
MSPEEAINVAVYENCNRGVVNITSKGLPGERFLFMEVPSDGSGSGSIIDREGHVLTNYHVVEKAQQVEVALFDGSTFDAKFVGADPVNDLAVIKIDAPPEKLFPIEIGDSSRLKVGMHVFAIGNPFGLERTMTSGIVSSLNRSLQIRGNRSIKAIIQTDAAVNPGNSGGPLLDSRGQLVGVNTAIATAHAGQSAGVALAIPATLVDRVVPQLLRHGRVIRPEIGIQQVLETERGLRIASITPGGPAERAGLRGPQTSQIRRGPLYWTKEDRTAADLIVAVDGEEVKTADDFLGLVEKKRPGDTVLVKVLRANQTTEVPVVLSGPTVEQPLPPGQPPL